MTSIKIILCFIFLFFFFLLILLPVVHSSHSHPLSSDHQTLSNSLKLSRTLSNSHLFVSLPPMRVKTQRHRPPKLNVTDPRADPLRRTPKSTQAPSHWSTPQTHAVDPCLRPTPTQLASLMLWPTNSASPLLNLTHQVRSFSCWPTPSNSQADPSPKPLIHASDPRRRSMPATHANLTRLSNALTHQLCLSSLKSDSPSPKLFLLIKWVFSIFFIYMLGIFDLI